MNRVQLVQIIVIIMAMMLGYQMINSFILFTSSAIQYFTASRMFNSEFIIYYGLIALLYAISLFVLLNSATTITIWIIDKIQPDENMKVGFSDISVLYAVLLFITIGNLIKNIPAIFYDLYEAFSATAGNRATRGYVADRPGFDWAHLLESVIAIVLLVNIKPVAHYFWQKIDPNDPHYVSDEVESVPENE